MTKRSPISLVLRATALIWLSLAVYHLREQSLRLAVAYSVTAAFSVFVSYATEGKVQRRYIISVLMTLIAAVLIWAVVDIGSI